MKSELEFKNKFEAGLIPLSEFNHSAHVKLAWVYLQEHPLPEAMIVFRDQLKRYIAEHGKSSLYHETITFAFVMVIHHRIQKNAQKPMTWGEFSQENSDLMIQGKSVLLQYYSEETLFSDAAKEKFLMPDRAASIAKKLN